MSNTRVFVAGETLPPLWLFEVPPLVVGGSLIDTACWIAAPNDAVAVRYLRDRYRAKGIAEDPTARKMRLVRMRPSEAP